MKVVIVHQAVPSGAAADVADVLDQVGAVREGLAALGHEPRVVAVSLDLALLDRMLSEIGPDVVVNLVEELGGASRLALLVPTLLEARGLPFTGSGSRALALADDKLAAKERLRALGIPTPPHKEAGRSWVPEPHRGRAIIKSVREHASFGLESDAVVDLHDGALDLEIERRRPRLGGHAFAEAYIHGRELNVAFLEVGAELRVLPTAEIEFRGLAPSAPRVVGYRAKWTPGTAEWDQTPRRTTFPPADAGLIEQVEDLARRAFVGLGLSGYGRVDLRVDQQGRPFVLEVNTNPCLSPGAGYPVALERAGIPWPEAVRALLEAGARRA